jgi:glycosyltransferase involved in cell wall biosynthesis
LDHAHYERDFCDRIASKGLDGFVEHLGLIPEADVSKWLRRSRFVFLPYGSGLSDRRGSFMAAIAHGKAVLTSPPAVKMSFLKNESNVLWPKEPSISGYVRLLEELLRNDELVTRLEVGARVLSQHFTWQRIAEEHELVLQMRQP